MKSVWKRPIHLWDAIANKAMRWRYYVGQHNAHNGALIECRWAKIGTVIELLNRENGRVLGTYIRGVNGVGFKPGRMAKDDLDKVLGAIQERVAIDKLLMKETAHATKRIGRTKANGHERPQA